MLDPVHDLKVLEAKAAELGSRPWLPASLIAIVTGTARLQFEAMDDPVLRNLKLGGELASADAHLQGKPLLARGDFFYDQAQSLALWEKLLNILRGHDEHLGWAVDFIDVRRKSGEFDPEASFKAVLDNDGGFFEHWAGQLPDSPGLARFLAKSSLAPALMSHERLLAPYHNAESIWSHGHCPHCGGLPLIGRLKTKEGARFHTCSFCRLEYRAKRLQCPFCLEENQEKLLVFSSPDEPGYEIHGCESCKAYIKLADFRAFDGRPSMPVIDDLESLPLDIAAKERGFTRLTTSEWGF